MISSLQTPRSLQVPFAHVNLRFNPFGELPVEERQQVAVVRMEQEEFSGLVNRLKRPGFVVQFRGACGRGKSTHLLALRAQFPEAPYVYFGEGAPIPAIPEAPLLFLDETQRLSPMVRRSLFRREASFVIGTHKDHARELDKAGVEYRCFTLKGLDPDTLARIMERRIQWASRDPGEPVPRLGEAALHGLLKRFGDDLRGMEGYLYDVFQEVREVGDVKV